MKGESEGKGWYRNNMHYHSVDVKFLEGSGKSNTGDDGSDIAC